MFIYRAICRVIYRVIYREICHVIYRVIYRVVYHVIFRPLTWFSELHIFSLMLSI